jgi:hypothetical protein
MVEPNDAEEPLIQGLRQGDPRMMGEFCRLYGPKLTELARSHMLPGLRRRVGPEDVFQSAFRTFLRRMQEGQFQFAPGAGK